MKRKKLKNKTGDNQDDVSVGELLARKKQTNKTTQYFKGTEKFRQLII